MRVSSMPEGAASRYAVCAYKLSQARVLVVLNYSCSEKSRFWTVLVAPRMQFLVFA